MPREQGRGESGGGFGAMNKEGRFGFLVDFGLAFTPSDRQPALHPPSPEAGAAGRAGPVLSAPAARPYAPGRSRAFHGRVSSASITSRLRIGGRDVQTAHRAAPAAAGGGRAAAENSARAARSPRR